MTTAVQGLTLSLEDALRSLTDNKGNAIAFEKQKDGSLVSKAVEGDNYTYTYSLVPQIQIVTVSVAKNPNVRAATIKEEKEAEKYNADKDKEKYKKNY
jgi:hypothetical protein